MMTTASHTPASGRGHADLPLHYGHVPPWLATRMATLGRAIVEAIVLEYGKGELLQRLSDPLWFQSFGAVLGMDWHSSGITTSVVGALKRAINPISKELTLMSEIIYGTPSRFSDPARYSFAHGGKDGKPFPVPTKVYDQTIDTLRTAVERARIGHTDKQKAIRSLHETARKLEEGFTPNDQFEQLIEREWQESHLFGGKTVMTDPGPPRRKTPKPVSNQLRLF